MKHKLNRTFFLYILILTFILIHSTHYFAKTRYYKHVSSFTTEYFSEDIDLNRNGYTEEVTLARTGASGTPFLMYLDGKRVLKNVKIYGVVFVDLDNNDNNIEVYIHSRNTDRIYRYNGKGLTLYAASSITNAKNPLQNYPNNGMLSAPFENCFPGNGTIRFKFSVGFSGFFDVSYKIKNRKFVAATNKTYKVKSEKPLMIGKVNYTVEKVKVGSSKSKLYVRNTKTKKRKWVTVKTKSYILGMTQ